MSMSNRDRRRAKKLRDQKNKEAKKFKANPGPYVGSLHCDHLDDPDALGVTGITPLETRLAEIANDAGYDTYTKIFHAADCPWPGRPCRCEPEVWSRRVLRDPPELDLDDDDSPNPEGAAS
jgi:hypothetical protein